MKNPYKRIKEIDADLEQLELREKAFKKKSWKRKPQELEKIEREIFFLVIERTQKQIEMYDKVLKFITECLIDVKDEYTQKGGEGK